MPRSLSALLTLCLFLAFSGSPALAWTPSSQQAIAREAARLAPPDLYRQLVRNRDAYVLGTTDPFKNRRSEDVVKNEDGSGSLDRMVERKIDEAIYSIELHKPFNEVSFRLGVVAHYLAEANNPLATSNRDREEPRYGADYGRYLESAQGRFQVVFYGFRRGFDSPRSLNQMLAETFERSRSLYPFISREYRRIGFAAGTGRFDDRSTAYGVGAIAFSHAVSDIAQVLRYIWLRAGGADSRAQLPIYGQNRILLARPRAG